MRELRVHARAAQHVLNRFQQSVRPRRGTLSPGSRRGRHRHTASGRQQHPALAHATPTHQPTAYTPTAPDSTDHVDIAHWLKTLPTADGRPSSGGAGVADWGTSESIPRWPVGGQTLPGSAAIVGVRPQSGLPSKHPPEEMPVMSITKILVGAAIAVGFLVGGAAQASADPNAFGADPNPFGGFSSSRQAPAPADGPALSERINRGLREGHSAWLPGLPAPTQPR